jgi:hypothetical protein
VRAYAGTTISPGVSDGETVAIVTDGTTGNGAWMQRFVNFEQPFVISARGRYDPSTAYSDYMSLFTIFTGNHSLGVSLYPTHMLIGAVPSLDLPAVQGTWYNVTFDARAPLNVDVYVNGIFVSNVEMYPTNNIIWDQPANKPGIFAVGSSTEGRAKGMVDYIRTTMCPLTEVPPKIPDRTPPEIRNVMFDDGVQAPANHLTVPLGIISKVWLNATIDDSRTGNSPIWSANYSAMPRTWPGTPMAPVDGALDWPVEDVTAEMDISGLPLGDYNYCVYARDYQGPKNLTGGCGTLTIAQFVPNTAMNPLPLTPADSAWIASPTINFTWQFRDAEGDSQSALRLQIDDNVLFASPDLDTGDRSGSEEFREITVPLSDGAWHWRVQTMDSQGLWGPYSAPFAFNLDRTPPEVTIEFGGPTTVAGSTRYITTASLIWLNGTDAGVGGTVITYSIDGGTMQSYNQASSLLEADGLHTIAYSSTDSLGNEMEQQFAAVVVDTTGPETTISLASLERGYSISVSSHDNGAGVGTVFVSVDGGGYFIYQGSFAADAFGNHNIRAFAVDSLGNVGAIAAVDLSVFNTKPLVAGTIGVVLLVIGLVMVYLDRKRKRIWGIAVVVVGIMEVVMAVLSWMTGALGIPPWVGVSLMIDIAMVVAVVILCALRWRSLRVAGAKTTPPPPPPPSPEPQPPAPAPLMEGFAQARCPHCGSNLPTGSTFCGLCGKNLG